MAEEAKKGVEGIKGLIEERRSIPKSDKQQLKEVSKRIKKVHQEQEKSKKKRDDPADA